MVGRNLVKLFDRNTDRCDVIVVGGGPAGLTFATEARRQLGISTLLAERTAYFGGTPQSTHHLGFGVRDLHRVMSGPRYARTLEDRARADGVVLMAGTTVQEWSPQLVVDLAGDHSRYSVQARAIVLATGVRERSRHARLVPGDRGTGVYTTGSLQRLVYQLDAQVGTRAVIVGAEHVSFTAISTLAHAGCETVALITPHERDQTFAPLRWFYAARRRIPTCTNDGIALIHGTQRVTGVTLNSGRHIECDTVVFAGDWIPENDLARIGGLGVCAGSRAPEVDSLGRTRQPGIFAIGNAVHPAEAADLCALNARRAVRGLRAWLDAEIWPRDFVTVRVRPPLLWTWPSLVSLDDADAKMLLRVSKFVKPPIHVTVTQAGKTIWSTHRRRTIVTNRSFTLPMRWMSEVDPTRGDVEIAIDGGV